MDAENKKTKPKPIWVVAANIKHEYSYQVGSHNYRLGCIEKRRGTKHFSGVVKVNCASIIGSEFIEVIARRGTSNQFIRTVIRKEWLSNFRVDLAYNPIVIQLLLHRFPPLPIDENGNSYFRYGRYIGVPINMDDSEVSKENCQDIANILNNKAQVCLTRLLKIEEHKLPSEDENSHVFQESISVASDDYQDSNEKSTELKSEVNDKNQKFSKINPPETSNTHQNPLNEERSPFKNNGYVCLLKKIFVYGLIFAIGVIYMKIALDDAQERRKQLDNQRRVTAFLNGNFQSQYQAIPKIRTIYHCDGRRYCHQMKSKEEVMYFYLQCPNTRLDIHHNGIPCDGMFDEPKNKLPPWYYKKEPD